METRPPPEFGPNGAVMNNPGLGEGLRAEYKGEKASAPQAAPQTLQRRLISSGGRLLLVSGWTFMAWHNGLMVFLPLAGFCVLMSAGAVVRSFWPMEPGEKSFWEKVFLVGVLAALLTGIWWLAPVEPFWIRITASGLLAAYVVRSFWRFDRIGGWLWAAVGMAGGGLIVWAAF